MKNVFQDPLDEYLKADENKLYSIDDEENVENATHFVDSRIMEMLQKDEEATPFIFTLTNKSANTSYNNLEIFNPITIQEGTINSDVGITYDLGFSYEQFVRSVLGGFSSKISKIEVISANKQLLLSPITIRQYSMLNESYSKTIIPTYNSFQNMQDQVEKIVNFYLTKETSIVISTLPANSSATYRFYPTVLASQINGLSNRPIAYKRPSLSGMPILPSRGKSTI